MGISIWQLLIILAIVLVIFGAKRLRNVGGDLGAAVKGFKNAMDDGKAEDPKKLEENAAQNPQQSTQAENDKNGQPKA